MLLDLLAVVIGFATVMLLLSLFVMSLVQVTQHVLSYRARNLENGIAGLLERVKQVGDDYDPNKLAREVIEFSTLPPATAGSLLDKVLGWAGRGKCTWLTVDELVSGLRRKGDQLTDERLDEVKTAFPLAERQMSGSLTVTTRYTTVFWSVLVACFFQVSTPTLLKRLTTDAFYRQELANQAEALIDQAERAPESSTLGQPTSMDDLPKPQPTLRDASITTAKEGPEVAGEATPAVPGASGRVRSYDEILDQLRTEMDNLPDPLVNPESRQIQAQLESIEITPWPHGGEFYLEAGNCTGVLMTTVLLTLGAPFWFNVLKNAVNLRDVLQPQQEQADGKQP